MSNTLRDPHGNRICPTCGSTLGINLGSQRRHDAEAHVQPVTSDPCDRCNTLIERKGVMLVLYGQKKLPKNVHIICASCEGRIDLRGAKV